MHIAVTMFSVNDLIALYYGQEQLYGVVALICLLCAVVIAVICGIVFSNLMFNIAMYMSIATHATLTITILDVLVFGNGSM